MDHCWHQSRDPRCDGFEREEPVYRNRFAILCGYDDGDVETYARGKKFVEHKSAYVCCRCHEAQTHKPRWGKRCPVDPATRAVAALVEQAK